MYNDLFVRIESFKDKASIFTLIWWSLKLSLTFKGLLLKVTVVYDHVRYPRKGRNVKE